MIASILTYSRGSVIKIINNMVCMSIHNTTAGRDSNPFRSNPSHGPPPHANGNKEKKLGWFLKKGFAVFAAAAHVASFQLTKNITLTFFP